MLLMALLLSWLLVLFLLYAVFYAASLLTEDLKQHVGRDLTEDLKQQVGRDLFHRRFEDRKKISTVNSSFFIWSTSLFVCLFLFLFLFFLFFFSLGFFLFLVLLSFSF